MSGVDRAELERRLEHLARDVEMSVRNSAAMFYIQEHAVPPSALVELRGAAKQDGWLLGQAICQVIIELMEQDYE